MTTESAIQEAIREHNSDITIQAFACAVVGAIGTIVTVIAVGLLLLRGGATPAQWLTVTLVVCAVLFLIGLISGKLRGGTRGATDRFDDYAGSDWLTYTPFYIADDITFWAILIWCLHGPYAFIEALTMLRARVNADDPTITAIAASLRLLETKGDIPIAAIHPPKALGTMLQLGLAKPSKPPAPKPSITITEKGRDAVYLRGWAAKAKA